MTPKQSAFVREYVIDHNGTQAAIRAGYSPHTANEQAAGLLAKPSIQEAVAALEAQHQERCAVTVESLSDMLTKDRKLAHSLGQAGAAVSATMGLAKLHGLIIAKRQNENVVRGAREFSDAELMAIVNPQQGTPTSH